MPCNQQRNQVPIYNKSFGDFIGTILGNKGEINDHVTIQGLNKMMFSLNWVKKYKTTVNN